MTVIVRTVENSLPVSLLTVNVRTVNNGLRPPHDSYCQTVDNRLPWPNVALMLSDRSFGSPVLEP